jgi:3-deoxy-D-manno-octulosonate 8-phosphate phosphatase (KDO 8-P phosphatase)
MVSSPAIGEAELRRRALGIELVLSDVDGVLTDAGVYYSARGEELKRFSLRDGMGVELLREAGIETGFCTRENSEIVAARAKKLRVQLHLGVRDKLAHLPSMLEAARVRPEAVAYIGDDVNDLGLLCAVAAQGGIAAAPADATLEVRQNVHFVTHSLGGYGAFREFADFILRLRA